MNKILTSLGTLGATAILIAGCGGGSDSSSSGASSSGASSTDSGRPGGAQFQKYMKCLSEHGVDLPNRNGGDGGFPGGGAPPNGGSLPEGVTPPNGGTFPEGGAPPNGGSLPDGVTPPNGGSLPEGVTPPNGGPNGGGFPGLDQSDPEVKKALDACASLQPSFPGGGGGFPGGAPGGSNGSTTNGQTN